MKDPAFLFYSKDFYEGTRLMLPEERGIYLDLLIFQHQHGHIPLDLKRIVIYCSGSTEAMLQAVLEAKFKRTDRGWINLRLEKAINNRENYKKKQSENGKIGQFWKKTKKIFTQKDVLKLRKCLDKQEIIKIYNSLDVNDEASFKRRLKRRLNIYANVNANVNANKNIKKGKVQFADFVLMTNVEYKTLIKKYGEHFTKRCIVKLNNYKGSYGITYKSDYRAILSWVVDALTAKGKSSKKRFNPDVDGFDPEKPTTTQSENWDTPL